MAGPGRAPKEHLSRPSDDARRQRQMTVVTPDDVLRGPDLPESHEWPPQTRAWWQTWRESPQAQAFTATDWDFLLDTALFHAKMWLDYDGNAAREVRLRVSHFGGTPEARLRLRMAVELPSTSASVTKISRGDSRRTWLRSLDGNAG